AGIVHGDLKPGNILVRGDGSVKLTDFGIASLLETAASWSESSTRLTGNVRYMAPEILQGAKIDPRGDIYSLGTLLFRVLTGREPFQGASIYQVIQAQSFE